MMTQMKTPQWRGVLKNNPTYHQQSSRMRCRQRSSKRRKSKQVRINGLQFEGNVKNYCDWGGTWAGVKLLSCFQVVQYYCRGKSGGKGGWCCLCWLWKIDCCRGTAKSCELYTMWSLVKLSFDTQMSNHKTTTLFFPVGVWLISGFSYFLFFHGSNTTF